MFKLLLLALATYVGYSIYLKYAKRDQINKSTKSNSSKKYSKMEISDAEFTDIDEE